MADSDSNSFLWFLAGLGFGAIAGILYAPRAGNETREALRSKAEDGREFVRERSRQAREQAAGTSQTSPSRNGRPTLPHGRGSASLF